MGRKLGLAAALAMLCVLSAGPCQAESRSRLVLNLEAGYRQTVVAYGTSLTIEGAWVEQFQSTLDDSYPGLATVVNSGGSGKGSRWGLENLDIRVLQKNPDTVFIEFAINDAHYLANTLVAQCRDNLNTMIDRILQANPTCEIIPMTMNPPVGAYLEERPQFEDYYQMYREVAQERKLLLIDHEVNWQRILKEDPSLFLRYVPDGIHPTSEGCAAVITPAMIKSLGITDDLGYGQLHVFVRGGDNAPYQIFWDGYQWHGWNQRDGAINEAPSVINYKGQLHLFVRGVDYALYQSIWDGSEWSGLHCYGGELASAPTLVNWNGQLHLFAVGGDHALYQIFWDGSQWHGWYLLGGSIVGSPAVVKHNGQLHLFVTGGDHALYQMFWDGSNWNGWYQYGGSLAYGPGAVIWNGQLHVFAVSGDHALYQMYWDGSQWDGWNQLGGYIIGSPAAVSYNGQLDVFVAGGDNSVCWKLFDGTRWSDWLYLGGYTLSAPGVASYQPGG